MPDLSKFSDADLEALAGGKMDAMSEAGLLELQRPDSGYKDVPDDKLNFVQKAERWAGDVGLVKPGRELFSPAAMENKKEAAPYIVGGVAAAAGMSNPLLRRLAKNAAKFVGKRGIEAAGLGAGLQAGKEIFKK